ncbi:uncharacterized protein PV09_01158 [Verruconis gallopava]|uniref:RNA helicase HEL117 n=1 Tax=Verruconis gallopava TaxID=253628 RepID=A0A0D2ANW7_9PEZI|nr:uncharacterized protein PV09_01158 [Verruconis gallopava]KIW08230.1 hypothetical protein PV09_01158 [Verruconis gallopava]
MGRHFEHSNHADQHFENRRDRSRSRSPYRPSQSHRHKRRRTESPASRPQVLPFHAPLLSKHDFREYKAIFSLYLDVQKELQLDTLDEREVKGRWKSFVGKWNRGELAEGWYDPSTKKKADHSALTSDLQNHTPQENEEHDVSTRDYCSRAQGNQSDDESEDDEFGPSLPAETRSGKISGPAIPNMQELELAAELRAEEQSLARAELAYSRRVDRKLQKEQLEELVPRADPGSRERQLEKKRLLNATIGGFKEAKEGGEVEVGDSDLMGDDGLEGFKRRKAEMERKKTERELRKEEQLRARRAEREMRLMKAKEKEEKTMEYLKALAKERYG